MKVLALLLSLVMTLAAEELRVLAYNIHHGVGMDGKLDLGRIAEVIRQQKPDLVALQEVDMGVKRSGKTEQLKVLAKELGMHHVFGKSIHHQGGEYGNAILSRFPLISSRVHQLPGNGEPRTVLEAELKVKGRKISFASVHFHYGAEDVRLRQAKTLHSLLGQRRHPVIVAGDFNSRPLSDTMRFLGKNWSIIEKKGAKLTMPADQPKQEIDYVILRWPGLSGASSKVINNSIASDHRAVLATLPLEKTQNP